MSGNPGGWSPQRALTSELKTKLAQAVPGEERTVARALVAKLIELAIEGSVPAHELIWERYEGKLTEHLSISAVGPALAAYERTQAEQRRYDRLTTEEKINEIDIWLANFRVYLRFQVEQAEREGESLTAPTPTQRIDWALGELAHLVGGHYECRISVARDLDAVADQLLAILRVNEQRCGMFWRKQLQ